jgi:hypothetical protein
VRPTCYDISLIEIVSKFLLDSLLLYNLNYLRHERQTAFTHFTHIACNLPAAFGREDERCSWKSRIAMAFTNLCAQGRLLRRVSFPVWSIFQ